MFRGFFQNQRSGRSKTGSGLCALATATLMLSTFSGAAIAGNFNMNLGSNPNWPGGATSHSFTLTDQYGFELDVTGSISQSGGTPVSGYPLNEIGFFGTATSIGLIWDAGSGNGSIGESPNTATLSFSSSGSPFAVDSLSFVISDIDTVDNNSSSDRCDFVTATGNAGTPTLSLVSPSSASVRIGPGSGSGATGTLGSNQAQCIYNTGSTGSPTSAGDDNGSVLATWPAGTSVATVTYDESIENVYGVTNRNAAARGIGIWASSVIVVNQSISLAKTANQSTYVGSGETIGYTYTVTNNGPLPINTGQNVQINDDQIGLINCPAITSAIAVGGTLTCTANYTTDAADATASSVVNIATAGIGTGTQSFASRLQSNNATATVEREAPSIALVKSAGVPTTAVGASATLTDGGDTITYSYLVTNNGNVAINNVVISDPGPTFGGNAATGSLSAFSPATASILPGASQTFTATYTLSQTDVDNSAGTSNAVSNTASAAGVTTGGQNTGSNTSTVSLTIAGGAAMTVSKTADVTADVPAGTTVTYTYQVTNTGNQTIRDISLNDLHNGSGPAPVPGGETLAVDNGPTGDSTDAATNGVWDILAPADQVRFSATYVVTQGDIDTLQ